MEDPQEAMENATTLRLLHLFEAHGHQICPTVENPCIDPADSCYAGWIDAGVLKAAFHHEMRPGEYTFYKTDTHFSAHVNSLLFKNQSKPSVPNWLYIKSYEAAATHLRGSRLTLAPPGGCPCLEGFVPNLTGFWAERAKVLRLTEELEDKDREIEVLHIKLMMMREDQAPGTSSLKRKYDRLRRALVDVLRNN